MLSSSNNQIYSTTSLEKSIQIHDENGNPISRFEQNQQLIDFYNYNFNFNFNPCLDEDFILLYSQKQQILGHEMEVESANNKINEEAAAITEKKKGIPRKRSSNKDRHSKICTLRGPRDRRMRLSLEIARNFFNLQDMLGFDKASKTVEWLFAKSRNAIKELKEKYLSEVSSNNNNNVHEINSNNNKNNKNIDEKKRCDFGGVIGRKFSALEEVHNKKEKRRKLKVVDKESRLKARARARERTRAKLNLDLEKSKGGNFDQAGHHDDDLIEVEIVSEDKVFSKEKCSDDLQVLFPGSSTDMGTVSLENMKASPAGLKLLELDEIDRVLIFYGELSKNLNP